MATPAARDERVARFNRIILPLLQELVARDPLDQTFARVQTQIAIGIREVPTRVIETAGPYLFKYRNAILDPALRAHEHQLRAHSFRAEFDAAPPSEKKEFSRYILEKLQTWWDVRSEAEFQLYTPALQELTRVYIEYLLLQKGIAPPLRPPPALEIFSDAARAAVRNSRGAN